MPVGYTEAGWGEKEEEEIEEEEEGGRKIERGCSFLPPVLPLSLALDEETRSRAHTRSLSRLATEVGTRAQVFLTHI